MTTRPTNWPQGAGTLEWLRVAAVALTGPAVTVLGLWVALGVPREGRWGPAALTAVICLLGMVSAELFRPRHLRGAVRPAPAMTAVVGLILAVGVAENWTAPLNLDTVLPFAFSPAVAFMAVFLNPSSRWRQATALLLGVVGLLTTLVGPWPPLSALEVTALWSTFTLQRVRGEASGLMRLTTGFAGAAVVGDLLWAAYRSGAGDLVRDAVVPDTDSGAWIVTARCLVAASFLWQTIWVLKSPSPPGRAP